VVPHNSTYICAMESNIPEIKKIPPYKCIESLKQFNELLLGYRMTYKAMLEYIKTTPPNNKSLQQKMIEIAEGHQENINQFYPE